MNDDLKNLSRELCADSSTPLYRQLSSILRANVVDGSWPEDTQIPTEQELSKLYDTSRITVRKAIDELVEDNLLIRKQGKGTYVIPSSLHKNPKELSGFSETCRKTGRVPGSILIATDTKIATQDQADFFGLSTSGNMRILRIKRVRLADNIPVMLETVFLPIQYNYLLAENLENSLYEILKQRSIIPTKITRYLDVGVAGEEEAKHLNVRVNTPLLIVKDYAESKHDGPIHISNQLMRPDLFKYSLVLEI